MISAIYEVLWRRIGGRPWTYISRQYARDYPLRALCIAFGIGSLLGLAPLGWKVRLIVVAALAAGSVIGHIFWNGHGPYIPGEKESKRRFGR